MTRRRAMKQSSSRSHAGDHRRPEPPYRGASRASHPPPGVAGQARGRRGRYCFRRYRHLADLRIPRNLRRPSQLDSRHAAHLRRAQPDLLVDDDHRRAEICDDHHARRQQGGGRQPGAARPDQPLRGGGRGKKWTGGIVLLGVFATALFYGDSMITPAISVLSAVEGVTTVKPGSAICRADRHRHPGRPVRHPGRGTAKVGLLFGPIMLVYFVTHRGARRDAHHRSTRRCSLEMLNPWNAVEFYLTSRFRRSLPWARSCSP